MGAGFIVTPEHALTCAHVVNSALGREKDDQRCPDSDECILFDFLGSDAPKVEAEVLHWFPVCENSESDQLEDIAVLRFMEPLPDTICPAPVEVPDKLVGLGVSMCGFPSDEPRGIYVNGTLQGVIKGGSIELHSDKDNRPVELGFSGTPAWDKEHCVVYGMIVSRRMRVGGIYNVQMISAAALIQAFSKMENMREIIPNYHEIIFPGKEWWFHCYQRSLPLGYKARCFASSSLWAFICDLADIPPQLDDDITALGNFIRKLIYIARKIKNKGYFSPQICKEGGTNEPIYLLVHLIPDLNNRSNISQEFKVHMYAWDTENNNHVRIDEEYSENNKQKKKIDGENREHNNFIEKEKIPSFLSQVIGEKFSETKGITIEFFLPQECINLDVLDWKRIILGENKRFIEDYKLVIRLDRFPFSLRGENKKMVRERWENNWNKLKNTDKNFCLNRHVKWICDNDSFDKEQISNEFRLTNPAEKFCLAMTSLPNEVDKLGSLLLEAGIPFALWCYKNIKNEDDNNEVKNELYRILEKYSFEDLSDQVNKICRIPEEKKKTKHYLALFWDDPSRVPLTYGK